MTIAYVDFIARRRGRAAVDGITLAPGDLHHSLKPFQVDVTSWAARVGRPAIWADTGLGKTRMQLEWCRTMADVSLIVAPLGVARQTPEEAQLIHQDARYVRHGSEITGPGVYVTNYEMVDQFDPSKIGAVALDEASILKQSDGKTRTMLIRHFEDVRYRSTWTATPAPNDPEELTNQAEFLGHMTRTNMLAAYFVHDQDGWRLKGHAIEPMLDWMSTWALAIRRPSDLGYDDTGYDLPGLNIIPEIVDVDIEPGDGELFAMTIGGVQGRSKVRRESMDARVQRAADIVNAEPGEPWLLWTGLNDEAEALTEMIPGAVNVHGSLGPDEKADKLLGFAHGDFPVLVTKLKIAGLGMNYQHAARMAFVGLNDSYEQYYQGIRRCHRYGQKRVVDVHIVLSQIESQIADNVARKEQQTNRVIDGLVARNATRSIA